MHRPIAFLALAALLLAPGARAQDVELETEEQKTLYAIGLAVAASMDPYALEEGELRYLLAGLEDGVLDREPRVALDDYVAKIREFGQARSQAVAKVEREKGEAFLAEAAEQEDAVTTDSGLVFIPVEEGSGESPGPEDTVRVHYHGTLRDGTVFDSSRDRGTPAEFPVGRVIPCWSQALQRMNVGGKATIYCPPDIAYADTGAPPHIKPGASLKFDVELLEIVDEGE